MPRFIQTDRVAVSDDNGNTVYVRRRMDLGAISRIQGAKQGEGLIALYANNILAWSGPDFRDPETGKPIKCTPEEVEKIDPNDPFWEKVAEKIAELNPRKETDDPLESTTAGDQPSTASTAATQESSISTSA